MDGHSHRQNMTTESTPSPFNIIVLLNIYLLAQLIITNIIRAIQISIPAYDSIIIILPTILFFIFSIWVLISQDFLWCGVLYFIISIYAIFFYPIDDSTYIYFILTSLFIFRKREKRIILISTFIFFMILKFLYFKINILTAWNVSSFFIVSITSSYWLEKEYKSNLLKGGNHEY
jgi:hypothetical protein